MLPIVSFPSTGGVDVSLHTLGLTRVRHRRRSLEYAVRLRRSETVLPIIDAAAALGSAYKTCPRPGGASPVKTRVRAQRVR
jgi:hypothetical protein